MEKKGRRRKTIHDYIHICVVTLFIMTLVSTAFSMAKYQITRESENSSVSTIPKTRAFVFETDLMAGEKNNNGRMVQADSVIQISKNQLIFEVTNCYDGVYNEEDILFTVDAAGDSICVRPVEGTAGSSYVLRGGQVSSMRFEVYAEAMVPGTFEGIITVHAVSPYTKTMEQKVSVLLEDAKKNVTEENGSGIAEIQNGSFTTSFIITGAGIVEPILTSAPQFDGSSYSMSGNTVLVTLQPYDSIRVEYPGGSNVEIQ